MIDYWPEIFRNSESFNDSKSFSFIISNGSRIDRQNNYCSNHFFKNKVEFSGKLIKQPQVKTLYKVSGSLKSCHSNIAKIEQSNVQKWIFLGFIFLSNLAFYETYSLWFTDIVPKFGLKLIWTELCREVEPKIKYVSYSR